MNRMLVVTTLLALLFAFLVGPAPVRAQPPPEQFYVSLGTSLAAGVQVDRKSGEPIAFTDEAYTDQAYQRLRGLYGNLTHVKLGCPGETSQNLIQADGGTPTIPTDDSFCYAGGDSQLQRAEAFLAAHQGEIAFITIDIGSNDVLRCLPIADPTAQQVCVVQQLGLLAGNLQQILLRLHAAAPGVPIVGVNYYNPFLAAWLDPGGAAGQAQAYATNGLVMAVNDLTGTVYGAFGVPVADVESAYETGDFTLADGLPRNVKAICRLTWMCEAGNIHPNKNGYKVIAREIQRVLK